MVVAVEGWGDCRTGRADTSRAHVPSRIRCRREAVLEAVPEAVREALREALPAGLPYEVRTRVCGGRAGPWHAARGLRWWCRAALLPWAHRQAHAPCRGDDDVSAGARR